ncbi:TetR/AcrR family transcriptional regulator [Variovorax sp. J22P271]|uniref:TetR/AcrR family transcriptional regulator n=1 Tax=Variovorax davisae TaxID=3053515 RepID=UPI002577A303|nr:TetR/AcrR family transcriptional regulator [Variovorax sp. J22P271]MDM0033273.1 TetR/AcrR family transcriptional regulator [Variovorax sp. J22P271]
MPSPTGFRPRRSPTQSRAQHTVAAIFEAAGLLAVEEGEEALTTNRIAERAGVSIGTLYQYFSTREDIVEAMVRQERARVMRQLDDLLGRVGEPALPPEAMLREFVRIYLGAFAAIDPGRRALVKLAWRADHLDSAVHSLREAAECIALHLQRVAHPALRPPTPAQAFVLTRALMGTVRAAVLEDSPVLGTREFEAELVRMCWALLAAESPA